MLETDHEEPAEEADEKWPFWEPRGASRWTASKCSSSSISQWLHRSQELLLSYLTVVPRAGNFKDRHRYFNRVRRGMNCSACHSEVQRTYFAVWLVVGAITVAFFRVFSDSVEVRVASVHGEQKPREEFLRVLRIFGQQLSE